MKTFAIDPEGKITAFESEKEAERHGASRNRFHSMEGLADLMSMVPLIHLVSIWNGMAGVKPVKKFMDKKNRRAANLEGATRAGGGRQGG